MRKVTLVGEQSIHLQSIGKVKATTADKIQVGMTLVWNFGSMSKVTAIESKGKNSLVITESYDGKLYNRTIRKNTLVAMGWEKITQEEIKP